VIDGCFVGTLKSCQGFRRGKLFETALVRTRNIRSTNSTRSTVRMHSAPLAFDVREHQSQFKEQKAKCQCELHLALLF
jgi:hypothetical protein